MRVRKSALEFSGCDESIFVHEMSPHVHLFFIYGKFANNIKR